MTATLHSPHTSTIGDVKALRIPFSIQHWTIIFTDGDTSSLSHTDKNLDNICESCATFADSSPGSSNCFMAQMLPVSGGVKVAYILVERFRNSDMI
ncbi:hypothetical protein GJ744_008472 [Endocarpon pusillum]|uniref:Uncharacterized protein n=1 Tax=Endocarpon pusillum TaxID=364733 RepID=A0A8H7ALD0_9EURO|nr:hypothetical protein GJ744_008472 [Endocarpon pusillum]